MPDTHILYPSMILRLRAFSWALNLTRLNILLLLITGALLSADQGQDLLLSMMQGDAFSDPLTALKRLSLFGSTALWALAIWLWARVLLAIEYPDPPVDARLMVPYRKHLPRLLAVLAFAIVAVNLARAAIAPVHYLYAVAMAVEGLLVWRFLVRRRELGRRLAKENPQHWAYAAEIDSDRHPPLLRSLSEAMTGPRGRIACINGLAGLPLFAWGMLAPLGMGRTLDTLLLLTLWGTTLLPWGSLVTYWANRKGVPVVTVLLVVLLACSPFNDNHGIRELAYAEDAPKPPARPTLEAALDDWKAANCSGEQCRPFVFVATAGGGIRAAYWTATVLGQLHDRSADPQNSGQCAAGNPFDRQLFGVSGVSGGSVGATVYRTASAVSDDCLTDRLQRVLGRDYLGPVSAGLLYPDAVQRFLPLPLLQDRASVFEQGLEAGYSDETGDPVGLAGSFTAAARFRGRSWPALFLNSTWSDNGRRIVGATLQPDRQLLYHDLMDSLGYDIRLSTAAHNSARFPLVSPAGAWNPQETDKVDRQRLQDGGLFENYGAETALEVLELAKQRIGVGFRPLVVLITSDPTLPTNIAAFPFNPPIAVAPELRSTFHTYAKVRQGRGAEAASKLKRWAKQHGDFAYFRMCADTGGGNQPPLGWALSKQAQRDIAGYLTLRGADNCRAANVGDLNRVLAALK